MKSESLSMATSSAPCSDRKNHGCPEDDRALESWVRKVNDRWLVHSGLQHRAKSYLDHLAATDRARLLASMRIVRELFRTLGAFEDPKPRFYAGVFSLATLEEAKRYLDGHLFTLSLIPVGAHLEHPSSDVPEVRHQVQRLREDLHKCILAVQAA
ncbi:MAG TPA: hypothetical protein VLE43_13335 [Candidatus Saccharimonadia bacterium]|nr:hypothetical protein [Candidatus Saccharimonadia bacterium]